MNPPNTRTLPFDSSVEVCPNNLGAARSPVRLHVPLAGSYNSVAVSLLCPPETRTLPLSNNVACRPARPIVRLPVFSNSPGTPASDCAATRAMEREGRRERRDPRIHINHLCDFLRQSQNICRGKDYRHNQRQTALG